MIRSPAQLERLVTEKTILEKYFPGRVTWRNAKTLNTTVEVVMTSNSNRQYTFRVYIPQDFPSSCPEMVLVSPELKLKNGTALPCVSQSFHTIGTKDGHVIICHHIPMTWKEENTIYMVLMKGRLWIEGYEGHLATGRDMDEFLKHQPMEGLEGTAVGTTNSWGCVLS